MILKLNCSSFSECKTHGVYVLPSDGCPLCKIASGSKEIENMIRPAKVDEGAIVWRQMLVAKQELDKMTNKARLRYRAYS